MFLTTLLTKVESSDVICNESGNVCPQEIPTKDKERSRNRVLIEWKRKTPALAGLSSSYAIVAVSFDYALP